MSIKSKWMDLSSKQRVIFAAVTAAIVIIIGIVIAFFLCRGYYAKTMRLIRIEGVVNLEDSDGSSKTIIDNMRFQSGQALSTEASSLAAIALDDSKVVTLDESSRVEFYKASNMMQLKLTSGALYFDVSQPLEDDESFDIKTSTMVVGIRGTSGWVYYDEDGNSSMVLTSGHVHITGMNPDTGEQIECDVNPGQQVTVYNFDNVTTGSVSFELEDVDESVLPPFVLEYIEGDADNMTRVQDETGWFSGIEVLETEAEEVPETAEATDAEEETSEATSTPTPKPTATETPTPTPENRSNRTNTTTAATTAAETTAVQETTAAPSETTAAATATPTPKPTSTPTPKPTATPVPTNTPTPEPTAVPEPTPEPTAIPEPTPDDSTGYDTGST